MTVIYLPRKVLCDTWNDTLMLHSYSAMSQFFFQREGTIKTGHLDKTTICDAYLEDNA